MDKGGMRTWTSEFYRMDRAEMNYNINKGQKVVK